MYSLGRILLNCLPNNFRENLSSRHTLSNFIDTVVFSCVTEIQIGINKIIIVYELIRVSREDGVHSPRNLIFSQCIGMHEDAGGTVIPEGIIKFRFTIEFVCSYKHRSEECLYIFRGGFNRIHIHLVLSVVGSEFYDIFFTCYDILDLILIQDSSEGIKILSSFFSEFCGDDNIFSSGK